MGAYTGNRSVRKFTVAITNSESTTEVIELGDGAAARIYYPANVAANTTLAIYDLDPSTGSYLISEDQAGAALTVPVQLSRSVNLPDEIFPANSIKLVSDTAAMTIGIVIKT